MVWPVTKSLSLLTMNPPTTSPTSSGVLVRPNAVNSLLYFFTLSPLGRPSALPSCSSICYHIAVPTIPGAYALTRILCLAISMAKTCVKPRTAHLLAL